MTRNPWINDEVPFEQYLTHARTKARAEAQAEVDHLGPANAEQRAEVRKSWRTWFWGAVRMYVAAGAVVALFGTVGVICMLLGAANSEVVLETFSEVLR